MSTYHTMHQFLSAAMIVWAGRQLTFVYMPGIPQTTQKGE